MKKSFSKMKKFNIEKKSYVLNIIDTINFYDRKYIILFTLISNNSKNEYEIFLSEPRAHPIKFIFSFEQKKIMIKHGYIND